MPVDLSDFLDEFDELSAQATRARHEDFARLLRRWFETFQDAPPAISDRVNWLMTLYPYERVETDVMKEQSGMGSGELNWPEDRELRLSAQLNLLRAMADEKFEAWNFASDYFYTSSNNINDILHEMTEHLFDVHVAELRRYLIRNADKEAPTTFVPGADRMVPVNHNQPEYHQLVSALQEIAEHVEKSNFIESDIKDVIRSEMLAAREVLKAPIARASILTAIVVGPLQWIAEQFATAAFAPTIQSALELAKFLFPSLPV